MMFIGKVDKLILKKYMMEKINILHWMIWKLKIILWKFKNKRNRQKQLSKIKKRESNNMID